MDIVIFKGGKRLCRIHPGVLFDGDDNVFLKFLVTAFIRKRIFFFTKYKYLIVVQGDRVEALKTRSE